jgi:hypothetical protein
MKFSVWTGLRDADGWRKRCVGPFDDPQSRRQAKGPSGHNRAQLWREGPLPLRPSSHLAMRQRSSSQRARPLGDVYGLSATLNYTITDTDTSSPNPSTACWMMLTCRSAARRVPGSPAERHHRRLGSLGSDRPQNIATWRLVFSGVTVPSSRSAATQVLPRQRDAYRPARAGRQPQEEPRKDGGGRW